MSKIIQTEWRSGKNTIGIVLVQRNDESYQAYIGVSLDEGEHEDAQYIADYGGKLIYREAVGFFPTLKESEYNG